MRDQSAADRRLRHLRDLRDGVDREEVKEQAKDRPDDAKLDRVTNKALKDFKNFLADPNREFFNRAPGSLHPIRRGAKHGGPGRHEYFDFNQPVRGPE